MRDHRFEHLGRDDDRHLGGTRLPDHFLLDVRHFLEGHVDAEVATGHHDRIDHREDAGKIGHDLLALELGDDRQIGALVAQEFPHLADVGRGANERDGDEIDALTDAEAEILAVLLGQTRDGQRHARERNALVVADAPAGDDPAAHGIRGRLLHAELDHPVIHPDLVTRLQLGQILGMGDAGAVGRPHDQAGGQREHPVGLEIDASSPGGAEGAEADLGALQVLKDGDGTAPALLTDSDLADRLGVLGMRAVGKVYAGHVHAGGDQPIEERGAAAGGPDGADDLGATHPFVLYIDIGGGAAPPPIPPRLRGV